MRIGINCIFFQPRGGGIKEYIYNLTTQLAEIDKDNDYILYVLSEYFEEAKKILPSCFKLKKVPYRNSLLSVIKRSLFSQQFWYEEERMEKFDIFHSPFFYAPKFKHAKLLITVHDLRLYRYPKTYHLLRYLYLKHSVKESIQRADKIISISQFTKDEIVDTCHVPAEKIKVIHEAINRNDFSEEKIKDFVLPEEQKYLSNVRFLFSVGHIEPRKNYLRLIDAFKKLKEDPRNEDLYLIIAGKPNLKAEPVIEKIKETDKVVYLDFVSREFLLWLYKHATLFVFPSYYEGFGFPPLEAACFGTISVVSNVSSIPEVTGESSINFSPYNVEEMAEKISEGLYDNDLIDKKKLFLVPNLDRFSWRKNAEETLMVYDEIYDDEYRK